MRPSALCMACLFIASSLPAIAGEPSVPRFDPADRRCPPEAVPLLVLGMFHLEPSGQDQVSTDAGDMLSPGKQAEIEDLLSRLKAYAPTRIAVEAPYKGGHTESDYQAYLGGNFVLSSNEIHQVGFRLARALGHASIYPVDFPMWMDGRVPAEIGTPKPRPVPAAKTDAPASAQVDSIPAVYRDLQQRIRRDTVVQVLRHTNGWAFTRDDQAVYINSLVPDPYSDALYGGSLPIENWYKRNLRIFTNILRISEPGQRVLVLIGSGHNAILRQLAIDSDKVCLVDGLSYLQETP